MFCYELNCVPPKFTYESPKFPNVIVSGGMTLMEVIKVKCGHKLPGGASGIEPACQCRRHKRHRFSPWVRKIPWRRAWQPTPVFLPGESHGQRSLVGPVHEVVESRTRLNQLSRHEVISTESLFSKISNILIRRDLKALILTPMWRHFQKVTTYQEESPLQNPNILAPWY